MMFSSQAIPNEFSIKAILDALNKLNIIVLIYTCLGSFYYNYAHFNHLITRRTLCHFNGHSHVTDVGIYISLRAMYKQRVVQTIYLTIE